MPTRPVQVVVLAVAALLAALLSTARAQPVIRVEAQTRFELNARRTEAGTQVRLLLLDDRGEAIAGAPIALRIANASGEPLALRARALTSSDGSVEIELPRIDEQISVDARFGGDDFRSSTDRVELLDTRLALTELRFASPAADVVDLREPILAVRLRARGEGSAAGLHVDLHDDQGIELGSGTTDIEGVAEIPVEVSRLGEPGAGKLIARLRGDLQRAPASAELAIVRWLPSQTSLALSLKGRDAIHATGVVRAGARGISGAPVGLFTPSGDHVTTLRADDSGRYAGALDPKALDLGRRQRALQLQARFESDAPWIGSSRSAVARLDLATPSSYSLFWLVPTPAAIALVLWWLGRRRRTTHKVLEPSQEAEAGVALAQTKPRAARPQGIACAVLDARTGRPIASASLDLISPQGVSTSVRADGRGALRVDELAPGSYQLVFRAQGYRSLRTALDSPHRGEWIGAHVRLDSLRDAALRAWSPLALRLATKVEHANAITLRETIRRAVPRATAQQRFADDALERAERAAYDRSAPTEDDVQLVERDASELLGSSDAGRESENA